MRMALAALGLNLAVFSALRLAFLWSFDDLASEGGELLQAFYLGLKFDLRLAVLVSGPLLLVAWLPLLNPARSLAAGRFWVAYFVLVHAAVLVLYAADFGHYGYTGTRLHGSALEHLTPLDVALPMVWQSYPVGWILLAVVLAGAGYGWLLRRAAPPAAAPRPADLKLAGQMALVWLIGVALLWGKWSGYPLRWSDAYFSQNPFVSSLAVNPVLFLADTLDERQRPFDEAKVRAHYPEVAALLGLPQPDPQRRSFARYVQGTDGAAARPNLVLIHLESFAGYKAGALGNPARPTPHFDALAGEGLLFSNFFVPNSPTARSVFTMLTGVPDYHPKRSASHNPLLVRQHTLINALEGYERYYFLGGSASWANIRGLLTQSIENLQVHEEGDYEAERVDVWGVTDHDVFEKAHAAFTRAKGPFFAFVQTSGNHRPYTIPDTNRRGFELAQLDPALLHAAGFDSLAAYNGLRFLDHALGHFFALARSAPYYRDTVFVLYGDHGNPAPNDIPWERLALTRYHVPMLIVAPGRVAAGRNGQVASSVDLLPTALTLMGISHLNKTLGRDLLVARPAAERFALVPDGLLTDDYLLRVSPRGDAHLYAYRSGDPLTDLRAKQPDKVRELSRLREALHQASLYLLHHNAPQPHAPRVMNKPR